MVSTEVIKCWSGLLSSCLKPHETLSGWLALCSLFTRCMLMPCCSDISIITGNFFGLDMYIDHPLYDCYAWINLSLLGAGWKCLAQFSICVHSLHMASHWIVFSLHAQIIIYDVNMMSIKICHVWTWTVISKSNSWCSCLQVIGRHLYGNLSTRVCDHLT